MDVSLCHATGSEFCRDVSDTQMPYVAPVILPQLLKVLLQPQVRLPAQPSPSLHHLPLASTLSLPCLQIYSVRTQSRAVHIFHTLSSLIYAASETTPTLATALLLPSLSQFVEGMLYPPLAVERVLYLEHVGVCALFRIFV